MSLPDYMIGGRPVTAAELAAAPPLDPASYLAVPSAPSATVDPLARRDRFTEDLIARGMTPADARTRAERTAAWTDRRDRG